MNMNKDLLFRLYGIFSPSGNERKMRYFIKKYIKKNCGDVIVTQDKAGNIYCTKGQSDTYPCLASHIDQIQDYHTKDFTCIEIQDKVFGWSPKAMKQQGLGADDKNGIWICLECLRSFDTLKVAFFVGEEIGCEGSSRADLKFFNDCRFVIEPDRRGNKDLITSMFCGSVCSDDFILAINAKKFGYRQTQGSVTDVATLLENGLGISCLNLSCGYYEAHTDNEYTVLSELEHCLHFVEHIINTCTDVYPFELTYSYPRWGRRSYDGGSRLRKPQSIGHIISHSDWWSEEDDSEEDYFGDDYEQDKSMMLEILENDPGLTFCDICDAYETNFTTSDRDYLLIAYDAAIRALRDRKYDELIEAYEKAWESSLDSKVS